MERSREPSAPNSKRDRSIFLSTAVWMVVVITVVIVGLWFLFADVFRISARAAMFTGELSGALFTLGGLVIALASVVTLLSVENRVAEAFHTAEADVNARFERQVSAQVDAHMAFFRATLAGNWQDAEKQAEEAIEKFPKLPGVRSFVALKMFADVEATFYWLRHDFNDNPDPRVFRPRVNMDMSPVNEAGSWLRQAITHNDQVPACRAALAQWYGVTRRYDKMCEQLTQLSPDDLTKLVQPIKLATLAYGCLDHPDEGLKQVGAKLSIEIPVHPRHVKVWILEQAEWRRENPYQNLTYFQWWVVPRPHILRADLVDYPRTVMIRLFAKDEHEWHASATYYNSGVPTNVPKEQVESQPFDEIMDQLQERFVFLCPDDLDATRNLLIGL